jgi:hypothetical protein
MGGAVTFDRMRPVTDCWHGYGAVGAGATVTKKTWIHRNKCEIVLPVFGMLEATLGLAQVHAMR